MHGIAVHGGAGSLPHGTRPQHYAPHLQGIGRAVDAGYAVLDAGGTALDAVTAAVQVLEDDPLFNAGRGAALARDGTAQLDAAVMDGKGQRAGAVACVRHVRNPVALARRVLECSPHVLLVAAGAEEFARSQGFELVPNTWFVTAERRAQLARLQHGRDVSDILPGAQGTVGAVACDRDGHLAAATSTGGMADKLPGRVGDSPLIGAGTWAQDGVCAVSTTGHGEYFIRTAAAHHVCVAVEHRGLTLRAALRDLLDGPLHRLGGSGGLIAIDARGHIAMECSTPGMFRGMRSASESRQLGI